MILYVPGDVWAWNVAVRYADREGTLLDDRERWTVRVGKAGALEVERTFLGTVVGDGELIASSDPKPELLKGKVEVDGTLTLEGKPSDPAAARALRRLLNPDRTLSDRVVGWPVVRHAVLREAEAYVPGSGIEASLRIEVTLLSARMGGKDLFPVKGQGGNLSFAQPLVTPTLPSLKGEGF